MTTKTWILLVVALLLGSLHAYYFTDWINTPSIQITKANRPIRNPRWRASTLPITFTFDGHYQLTSVRVFDAEALTDPGKAPTAKPLWHLVSKRGSEPVRGIAYGAPVRGMQPAVTNARPAQLQAGVKYRLLLQAGRARGELDFQPAPVPDS